MIRFPAGESSTSIPGSSGIGIGVGLLGLRQPQAAVAPREERRGDLGEVPLHGVEGLREPAVDRFGQLVAELAQLVEGALEILALRAQLGQPLLLARVLLLRERVDAAELIAAALQPVELLHQLVARPFGRLRRRSLLEATLRFGPLRLEPRVLDVDSGDALRRIGQCAPELDLAAAESAQLRSELARADGSPVGLLEQRCLETLGGAHRSAQHLDQGCAGSDERGVGQSRRRP